jgi:hypothetical protein
MPATERHIGYGSREEAEPVSHERPVPIQTQIEGHRPTKTETRKIGYCF